MGDRVLITFTQDGENYSPAVYMHWSGSEAPDMIRAAALVMRKGDESYSAARFCGECHKALGMKHGPVGLGILPGPQPNENWEEYSHGDAGVYVVNVATGEVQAHGGYGKPFQIDPAQFADV